MEFTKSNDQQLYIIVLYVYFNVFHIEGLIDTLQ